MNTYETKANTGAIFANTKRTSEQQPNARGDCVIVCPHCRQASKHRISAWTNTSKAGAKYQALKLSPFEEQQVAPPVTPSIKQAVTERSKSAAAADPISDTPQFDANEIPF